MPATILTSAADAHGRVIAYLLRACASARAGARAGAGARRHRVTPAVLEQTANYALLEAGHVYPLAYTSQPRVHRDVFRDIARKARAKRIGVWSVDATARGFDLRGARSVGPSGALIFPKLFRRCIDYFADRVQGFDGSFVDWRGGHGSGAETRPDRVVHAANVYRLRSQTSVNEELQRLVDHELRGSLGSTDRFLDHRGVDAELFCEDVERLARLEALPHLVHRHARTNDDRSPERDHRIDHDEFRWSSPSLRTLWHLRELVARPRSPCRSSQSGITSARA